MSSLYTSIAEHPLLALAASTLAFALGAVSLWKDQALMYFRSSMTIPDVSHEFLCSGVICLCALALRIVHCHHKVADCRCLSGLVYAALAVQGGYLIDNKGAVWPLALGAVLVTMMLPRTLLLFPKDEVEKAPVGPCPIRPVRGRAVSSQAGLPGDFIRGLSIWFIKHCLMKDLEASDDNNVYHVEPMLRKRGKAARCPRDGKLGAAYVDIAQDPHAATSTVMLSYTWGYKVKDIVDALVFYGKTWGLPSQSTRVWLCFACVNQHRVKEASKHGEVVPFEEFAGVFGERVKAIGNVVCMLAPWSAPAYLQRVWCCYELFVAMTHKEVKVEFILPPSEAASFSESFFPWRPVSHLHRAQACQDTDCQSFRQGGQDQDP